MEYRSVRIKDVIGSINKDYFLPAIQREFVWDPDQIETLFDSILGDYPIGSFLFWKVNEQNKEQWTTFEFIRQFDKAAPHNPEANVKGIARDILLVLDGQQRMSSLFIGLKGSYRFFRYRWRTTKLYLNLLKRPVPNEADPQELVYQFKFRESSDKTADGELWYEVGRILDFDDSEDAKADIKASLASLPEPDKDNAHKLIGRLHNKIHTLPTINYYEERSQDYDKVLTIFVRANSAGTPLEYSDLLLSTATAKWEKLNARDEIVRLVGDLNDLGGGDGYRFGKDFVLKASLYLTSDLPIQYKVKNFTKPNLRKIEDNWENIKIYLNTTVRLVAKFGYRWENIVAPLALLPIAFWLLKNGKEKFDKSSQRDEVATQSQIRKWLTLAWLKNSFGASSDTTLKNLRDVLLTINTYEVFPSDELNAALKIESRLSDAEVEALLAYNYRGKYTYLVLSLLYPDRDWKDVVFHEDHVFPASGFNVRGLRQRGYDDQKIQRYLSLFNTVLNLELLNDTENLSKNATPFDEWVDSRDEGFKKRHAIPELDSYDMDAFEGFIVARKQLLTERFKVM
jgi:hypothetical protein